MHGFNLTPGSLVLGGITGYLIGAIPFAYILTRLKTGKDLRREGTGNIGAANTFDVTGDRSLGASVLAADFLKGLLPVLAFALLGWQEALLVLIPALVLGHCYPVWLRFHGGRGLATSAGAMMTINPGLVVIWLLTYALSRRVKDQVHFASIIATAVTMAAVLLTPIHMLSETTLGLSGMESRVPQLMLSVSVVLLIILSRHVEPFIALIRGRA